MTIIEIAKELGVDKQVVYRFIKRKGYSGEYRNGGSAELKSPRYYDKNVLKEVKEYVEQSKKNNPIQNEIEVLRSEITDKDNIIAELREQNKILNSALLEMKDNEINYLKQLLAIKPTQTKGQELALNTVDKLYKVTDTIGLTKKPDKEDNTEKINKLLLDNNLTVEQVQNMTTKERGEFFVLLGTALGHKNACKGNTGSASRTWRIYVNTLANKE